MKKYLFLLLFALPLTASAQMMLKPGTGLIIGIVIDDQDKPLPYTTVLLYNNKDSLINGYLTDTTGLFLLKDIPFGTYSVEVKFVGFEAKKLTNIHVSKQQRIVKIGKIKISPKPEQIKGVTVTGTGTGNVVYKIDKKVIYPSKNIQSTGGSAVDVLRSAPSVQVDYDNNVSLRGSQSFKVLINGKPTALDGNEALKEIPASSIEKIEIITNPSAKYDPDGITGIINVITKKKADSGLSGKFEIGADTYGGKNADIILTYRTKKYEILGQFTYMDKKNTFGFTQKRITNDSIKFSMLSNGQMSSYYGNTTGRLSLNFFPNKKNNITLNLQYGQNTNGSSFDTKLNTSIANTFNLYFLQNSFFISTGNLSQADLTYEHKFSQKKKLTLYTLYSLFSPTKLNQVNTDTTDVNWQIISQFPYQQKSLENITEKKVRAQLDYEQPIGSKGKLQAGAAYRYFQNPSNYNYYILDYTKNEWALISNLSSSISYFRNIYAGYVTVTIPNKIIDFELGIRSEYTDRSIVDMDNTKYVYSKLDFFPTLHMSKALPHNQQIQLSYSRRINRPSNQYLNPSPVRIDNYTIQNGNPELKPEYTNSFEFNYLNKFGMNSITLEAYVRQSQGKFSQIQLPQGNMMTITWANINKETFTGVSLSGNFVLLKMLILSTSIDAYYDQLHSTFNNEKINKQTFSLQGNAFLMSMLPTGTIIQLGGFYIGRKLSIQGEMKPLFLSFIGLRQNLLKNRLSISMMALSPFRRPRFSIINSDEHFNSQIEIQFLKPLVSMTITYRLHNFKEQQEHKSQKEKQQETMPFTGQGIY